MSKTEPYLQTKPKYFWLVFFISLIGLLAGTYASLRFGAITYSHHDLLSTLARPELESDLQNVIIDTRLPRLLAAGLVGAGLSCAGAMMQGITKNNIADPGLLGINAGASLALVIGYSFAKELHYLLILFLCLVGASFAASLVFAFTYHNKTSNPQLALILSGAMVTTLFSAIGQAITITNKLSTTIIGWQSGGLIGTNWTMLHVIAPFILIGLAIAQLMSHQLTILSLDSTISIALGQNTQKTRLLLLGIVLILSASSIALVGNLAFIGLLIPHLVRLVVANNYRYLLPLSMLLGAGFMVWIDLGGRLINSPYETSLNAMVSLLGLPCFLFLVRRGQTYDQH
ncbi:FecCD family ABC transporter permease [Streptococcus cuniculipharyngis]|uniref:Iron ABC transporter permease n=1 Tax=Streptococcus cuniculipharyngis TaxID=1562651 RepID=A0A5C5S8M1_9STRE|nr:iron ABC transporter permease [Streptococcus cuniculipharyngis]TWS96658.1 iron ABC transporter permease [Streptococcus cuniculipharyngis]